MIVATNRRAYGRKNLAAQVHCKFEANVTFPGLDQLTKSKWTCVDLGQGGMLLEAREPSQQEEKNLEKLQNSVFTKGKSNGKVYYPALPPEKLKVAVEMKFSKKQNAFTFHGLMVWFRHVSKGVYRMGVHFEEGQDLHIYEDKKGEIIISAIWRQSDL